ncbi:hypothetical protein SELMODRAFT_448043 [Selaginella moellendorffii]|uniref:UDENN domain-containing protein n=1 Tax=Selaginella moellendorffii TaxID=88036 RepID=D8T4F7_SELML|nr:uncharacterized protein LOC9631519 [Selaginella moellendorffii]EFJ08411.1 hypothetical protein SELMODRAFT_448043 [Selaginella moellendorffii]|eukprot:XP_002990534.1 uncharacterized protein LOC9631519 [Selaginella moellendorffii]
MDDMEASEASSTPGNSEAPEQRSFLAQTTEEVARAAVAAAAAIRPRPSIVVSSRHPIDSSSAFQNNNSFNKWRRQLQKVWKWGLYPREGGKKSSFNPELLTKQKRQWIELQLQALEKKQKKEPTSIFEHFVVVGLHPETNVEVVEAAFAKKKAWERNVEKAERLSEADRQYRGAPAPTLEPQVLFKYPPGKRLPLRSKDLPSFCFPSGVEAKVVERTPSMSDLNEVVYGQDHQVRDDLSFVFVLKVADNATLYGICIFVREIVQRAPGFFSVNTPLSSSRLTRSRFLVSAPRCYCILTKLPFFHLHFEVLQSIIAQERLDRINQCVSEMKISDYVPPLVKLGSKANGKANSPRDDDEDGWMESAIPVEDVLGATAAAAGLISESEMNSFSSLKHSSFSERDTESGESAEICATAESRESNGHMVEQNESELQASSPDDVLASSTVDTPPSHRGHERAESSDSIYSVVESCTQSLDSDEENCETSGLGQDDIGVDSVFKWAEENNCDALRIICMYYQLPVPPRGSPVFFRPLDHLQPLNFVRPREATDDPDGSKSGLELAEAHETAAAEEEAILLSLWTVSTVCRSLSLDTILSMVAGALLERQMVVVCPNVGILCAVVLSIIPMLRPFQWQSLLLPVLPYKMLDFLDAPVPFVVGVQHKSSEVRSKISNLMRVNVYKNQVTVSYLPQLPRQRELVAALETYHSELAAVDFKAKRHPVHEYTESQAQAADGFLRTLRSYLESLCADVRAHTITNVQSNNDRVSLLLKESFIDSFPSRDRPFIKLFADTQLFSVHTDAVLSSF